MMSTDNPFSSQMLLLYANTFQVMLQFTIVQPTAAQYVRWFGITPKLGGALIAASQFGSAVFQIPIFFMLRHLPFKLVILFLLSCEILGNIFYSVALPLDQVAVLFVGRAISSFCSGQQIYLTGITQERLSDANKKIATQINSLMYQIAGFLSLTTAAFILTAASYGPIPTTNASTIPGYVAAFFVLLLFVFTAVFVPTKAPLRFRIDAGRKQTLRAMTGWYIIVIVGMMEGLRQVTIFELFDRWREDWDIGLESVSLIAAFIFLSSAISYLYDRKLKYTKRNMSRIMLSLSLTMLPLAPWRCATAASVLLQSIVGCMYATFVRIMYGYATFIVIQAARRTSYIRFYYFLNAFLTSIGIGIGATVSSIFDLSVIPFMILLALSLVAPLLIRFV